MPDLLARLAAALADRYRVDREIGRGGMAHVFLAHDLKLDRPVAVKVLRPDLAAVLGGDRFLREIELAAKLTHPHILAIYDRGVVEGGIEGSRDRGVDGPGPVPPLDHSTARSLSLLYYVMPYVEGESLRDRLNREKQLPVDDALQISREVADALSYAHSHGVIHRDIKPENILLESGHAVVADFGIARAIDAAGGDKLTETGVTLGTPAYMSPEQAGGSRDLDGRSDLYSLGCVLYEMLAGQPPFTGPTVESVVHQHLVAEPAAVMVLRPSVPAEVVAVLERSLAKAPADRFSSGTAFGEAIAPTRVIGPRSAVRRDRRATRRRLTSRALAGAAVLGIAVVGGVLLLRRMPGGALDPNRVLVVAFADETGLEASTGFGRMAQDYIIQVLTDAGFAKVIDPLTALAVSQNVAAAGIAAGDVLGLADEARAGTIVSGRYYVEGDSIHVQTRITDANDGSLMGTVGPIVGSIGARSELVARLGHEVVVALASLMDQDVGAWEPPVRPASYEAYGAYSEGFEAYLQNDWPNATRKFLQAVELDPAFHRARLWAGLSYLWTEGATFAGAQSLVAPLVESPGQLSPYERCRLDFVVALGIRLSLPNVYEATRCMVRAAPGSEDAKREVANLALVVNRPREAIRLYRELDPDRGLMRKWAGYWVYLARAYYSAGDYEGELETARQGRQRFPEDLRILLLEAQALVALGRLRDVTAIVDTMRSVAYRQPAELYSHLGLLAGELREHGHRDAAAPLLDEAIAWAQSQAGDDEWLRSALVYWLFVAERWDEGLRLAEELAEEYPQRPTYLAALGIGAARRGDREEALRISERLRSFQDPWLVPAQTLGRARIAAFLGDREAAMTLLQEAIDLCVDFGHLGLGWGRGQKVFLEPLRDYPPFQEFSRPKG